MKKRHIARVVFLHGAQWGARDKNMHRLAVAFREAGFCVVIPRYGYVPALLVGMFSWLDYRIAQSMSVFIQDEDILVGHSNGATLAHIISQTKRIRGAVLINAALEVDEAPNADFVHVYYNYGDCVAKWSAIIPFHPWGAMGSAGYQGERADVVNIDQGNPPENYLPRLNGHSDVFTPGKIRSWARYMASRCIQALKGKQ